MIGESAYLFKDLSAATSEKIMALGGEVTYAPGQTIFRENEAASDFYILTEGHIRLRAGRRPLLAHVANSAGDVIGWSSLVGNTTYSSSAECMTSTRLIRIAKQQLDEVLEADPVSGMKFFKNLAALVGQRLVHTYLASVSWDEERQVPPAA